MNLFKSFFSGDGDVSDDAKTEEVSLVSATDGDVPSHVATATPTMSSPRASGASWNFSGLVQTLAAKSESVIQTYRRDLEEFRSGLIAETAAIRAAVKDLPDAGASAAHASLESVGQAIDDIGSSVWREIVSHSGGGGGGYFSDADSGSGTSGGGGQRIGQRISYTRLDASIRAIQSDVDTYREDPEDTEYSEWKLGFQIDNRESATVLGENRAVEEIYRKLVPGVTDEEMFWCRYFFRVHKMKQAEEARASIVKKAMSGEDEELTWDLDEEGESEEEVADFSVLKLSDAENTGDIQRIEIDEDVHLEEHEPSGWVVERWREEKEEESKEMAGGGGEEETEWDEVEDVVGPTERRPRQEKAGICQEGEELSWDIDDDDDGDDDGVKS